MRWSGRRGFELATYWSQTRTPERASARLAPNPSNPGDRLLPRRHAGLRRPFRRVSGAPAHRLCPVSRLLDETGVGYWSAGVGVFAVLVVWARLTARGRKDKERLSER